jgi:curved DNA-binding protein CbpA
MTSRRSHYEILEVGRDASPVEIRRAYRRLARRYHPDVNAGADARARFDELSQAYEVLHDPQQRARYDRASAGGGARAGRPRPASSARPPRPASSARAPRSASTARPPVFTSGPPPRDVPRFLDEDLVDSASPRSVHISLQFRVRLWPW